MPLQATGSKPVWPPAGGEATRTAIKNKLRRLNVYAIGVDAGKEQIYSRLGIAEPGPGYCHFSRERDIAFFQSLTAEHRVPKIVSGKRRSVWMLKTSGARNEVLDCWNYGYAAVTGLQAKPFRLDLARECDRVEQSSPEIEVEVTAVEGEAHVSPDPEPEPDPPAPKPPPRRGARRRRIRSRGLGD